MSEPQTPAGVIITATNPEGEVSNITEGVQVLYDHLIQSMDWGSGFLSVEDVEPIVELAKLCGFKEFEEAEKYIEEERRKEFQRQCSHDGATREKRYEYNDEYAYVHCANCDAYLTTAPIAAGRG